MPNPFTPTFGAPPPLLVGRDDLIQEFEDGLDGGTGDPARATLYVGHRGVGKTVLLNAVEDAAAEREWVVVNDTGTKGFIDRLVMERLPLALREVKSAGKKSRKRSTGITAPGGLGGASWETVEDYPVRPGLRVMLEELTDQLAQFGVGVLISIDEIHYAQAPEVAQLCAVIQHAFREGRDVAFVGASLGSAIDALLNEPAATFLRRAERHQLGPVSVDEAFPAFVIPVRNEGRSVSEEVARFAAEATGGYPFLIQLIGRHMWSANPKRHVITRGDVEAAIPIARRRLGSLVFAPAIKGLSDVDKTFLVAMARDGGPSRIRDVAERMGVDGNYANVYRRRLLDEELIVEAGHGRVVFATPGLDDYLREHVVIDGVAGPSGQ